MKDFASSIRAKLTDAELSWIKDQSGLELRDPKHVAALEALEGAARELYRLSEINDPNRLTRSCSFCGEPRQAVGPLAQGQSGAMICRACAGEAVEALRAGIDE